jgi:phospholipid/cholesterol/gamma-HCH transport system permease protein
MAAWQLTRHEDRLAIAGDLRMQDAAGLWRALEGAARTVPSGHRLDVDITQVGDVDGTNVALLVALRASLVGRGVPCEILGARGHGAQLVHLFRGDREVRPVLGVSKPRAIARVGAATERALRSLRTQIELIGDVAVSSARIVRHPAIANWTAVPSLLSRAGADGIPIVLVLNFLVGFVMAYQSSYQLQLYGANIYVADVVGISVTRELGPLMTAIIMAGRSGAAYAAELGTMRVSEEIDAMRTLGIPPVPYLVVPRILALAAAAPMLTILGDVIGVIGGIVVGAASLEITPRGFIVELQTILVPSDVWTGLVKSIAFGAAIGFIGCQQGLATRGAASGVGRGTTRTVVACLFTIVIIDTVATVLFRAVGL